MTGRGRALALHGLYMNAETFKSKAAPLLGVVGRRWAVDFVDAPNEAVPAILTSSSSRVRPRMSRAAAQQMKYRAWWPKSAANGGLSACRDQFDASVRLVGDTVRANNCSHRGVIGYSQGGALATLMCTNLWRQRFGWSPRFAVFIAAYKSRLRCHSAFYDSGFVPGIRTLHIWGTRDCVVSGALSQDLADTVCADAPADPALGPHAAAQHLLLSHDGGHVVPSDAAFLDRVADFLDASRGGGKATSGHRRAAACDRPGAMGPASHSAAPAHQAFLV